MAVNIPGIQGKKLEVVPGLCQISLLPHLGLYFRYWRIYFSPET